MLKFNDHVRDFVKDVNTFLSVDLHNETLSPAASSAKTELQQKLQRLCQEYPRLLLSLDITSAEQMQGWKLPRPLSSPHPYIDMQVGGVLAAPRDVPVEKSSNADDSSNDYVYSEAVLADDAPGEVAESAGAKTSKSGLSRTSSELEELAEDGPLIDIPASEMSKADKTGFLEKKGKERLGGLLSPFQKRWCAVRDGYLFLYEKPTDKRQKGQIALDMYEARPFVYASKDASKKDAAFEIVCPGKKTYQFIAFNMKDMKQWISAIEKNSQISSPISSGDLPQENPADVQQPATQPPARKLSLPNPRQELPRVPPAPISSEADRELEYEYVERPPTIPAPPEEEEPLYEDGESYFSDDAKTSSQTDEEVTSDYESWYQAIWDCHAGQPDELSFKRGDLLKVVSKEYDEHSWWVAQPRGNKGSVGFVPKTYLMAAYEKVQ